MTPNLLPMWRGFNLLDMFTVRSDGNFREADFQWLAEWGFNFARIPACYTLWTEPQADPADVYHLNEAGLEKLDRAVRLGEQYGIHINLNFHRGPGFSVNPERQEPFDLWKDQAALDAFCFHWQAMARRYQGISNEKLSFNLINEPVRPVAEGAGPGMTRGDHERVMRAAVAAVRAVDPARLIILDGLTWGNETLPELADLGTGQSCRAYAPMNISHYEASWVQSQGWPEPTYPGQIADGYWDRARLEAHYAPWIALKERGVGVHCGEGGAFSRTPHKVVLAWLNDVLDILTSNGIGYALWNFRGEFGILDSHRNDVQYEDWHGHQLDRELLTLLQKY